jgi:hypothetical protein
MSVINALNTTLYSLFSGDSTLITLLGGTAVYFLQAPDGAALPYVVWSLQAGGPRNDTHHNARDEIIFARGYASTPALAGSIDAQVSSLLHRKILSVSGYNNFWTSREEDFALVENPPDRTRVYMAGATYRIRLS